MGRKAICTDTYWYSYTPSRQHSENPRSSSAGTAASCRVSNSALEAGSCTMGKRKNSWQVAAVKHRNMMEDIWWKIMSIWNMYDIGNWCNTILPCLEKPNVRAPRSQIQQCSLDYRPEFGRSIQNNIKLHSVLLHDCLSRGFECLQIHIRLYCVMPVFSSFLVGFILASSPFCLDIASFNFQAIRFWYYQQHWALHHFLQLLV